MAKRSYKKLRLQGLNSFDIERILKDNVELLKEENGNISNTLEELEGVLSDEEASSFAKKIEDYSAEMLHILSMTHHIDDVHKFFSSSPFYRRSRDKR